MATETRATMIGDKSVNDMQTPQSSLTQLASGATISLLGKIAGRLFDFLKQVAIARLLGPTAFGLYALGWNLLRIASNMTLLGLNNGLIHFATPFQQRKAAAAFKGVWLRTFWFSVTAGIIVGTCLFLLAPFLAVSLFKEPELTAVLRWFAMTLPLLVGMRMAVSATQISQRMQFSVMAEEFAQTLINLLLFLGLYFVGWKLLGALIATAVSFGVAFVLALYYVYQLFPAMWQASAETVVSTSTLLTFSIPTSLAGLSGILMSRMDRLLIGYFLPAADVGIYQAASQFSIIFAIILNSLSAIFVPMIADLHHRQETRQLEKLYRITTKWGLYASIPLFLVICFAPADFMRLAFGELYANGGTVLLVLTVGQMINTSTGAVGFLLIMTGNQNKWLWLSGSMMVVNLVLNWLLIPQWGGVGSAAATMISIAGLFWGGLWVVRQRLHIWPYDKRYLKGSSAAVFTVMIMSIWVFYFPPNAWLPFLGLALLSASVFLTMLLLLGLDEEDRELLNLFQVKLRKKST